MDGQFPADYNLYPQQQEIDSGLNHEEPIEYTGQVQLTPYGAEKERQEKEQERLRLQAAERFRTENAFLFTDKRIRNAFIRKVYAILTMQITIVGFIIVLIYSNKSLKNFFEQPLVFYAATAFCLFAFISLACCESVARKTPVNYIFLFVFTAAMGILLSLCALRYGIDTILMAVGITAFICFCVTVFAFQTSIDFTSFGMYFCVILMVFSIIILILSFFKPDRPVMVVIASIGVLIYSFILIYDTQLMLGGNHRYAFSPEDYIFASLTLFLDIINIFMFVLQILAGPEGD